MDQPATGRMSNALTHRQLYDFEHSALAQCSAIIVSLRCAVHAAAWPLQLPSRIHLAAAVQRARSLASVHERSGAASGTTHLAGLSQHTSHHSSSDSAVYMAPTAPATEPVPAQMANSEATSRRGRRTIRRYTFTVRRATSGQEYMCRTAR